MRIATCGFVVLLLLTFSTIRSVAGKPSPNVDSVRQRLDSGEVTRVVCFGDSITGAYYHTGGQRAWCDMLKISLERTYPKARIEMVNAGISGDTTIQGLDRIQQDVLSVQPHLVVVMFGMNDVTRLPLDEFATNLKAIAHQCRDVGAAVVLCTPNSVHENPGRPIGKLRELSQRIRQLAKEQSLPVADCFADYLERRGKDETAWMLMMSDEIHPNMHGHRRIAELVAQTISGHRLSLDDVPPLDDALHHTLDRLEAGEAVHLVAMSPYDEWMPAAIRDRFPNAQIRVTKWPTQSKSMNDISRWGAGIRELKPDLVVPAVPVTAMDPDTGSYIRDYEWVLNWSFPFAGRAWDVVPVLPTLTSSAELGQKSNTGLGRQIVLGKDIRFPDRSVGDPRPATAILASWIAEQAPVSYDEHQGLGYYLDRTRRGRHEVRSPRDWQIRRRHILDNLERVMGRMPDSSMHCALDVRVIEESRKGNVVHRKLSFQSDPFDRVTAWLLLPTTPHKQKRPAILCLHQTVCEGKDEPVGLAGSPNMHYGRELAEQGFIVLAPDYPSFGDHAYEFARHPEFVSGSLKAVWDNRRSVDLLVGLPEVDPERIGVIGHSLGGHNALFTAVFEPRLKVVVSSCGFTSLLKDDLPSWTGPRYMPRIATDFGNDIRRMPFDFAEIVACIAPRPLLACAATRDDDFDVSGVRDVITAAQPIYTLLGGARHLQTEYPDSPHDFPKETRAKAFGFLDRYLRPDGGTR